MIEGCASQSFKDRPVVLLSYCLGDDLFRVQGIAGAGFMVENSVVEVILVGKVPKDHCLGDAGHVGNLLGGRTAEALLGEEAYRHPKDLQASLFTCHSRSGVGHASIVWGTNFLAQC